MIEAIIVALRLGATGIQVDAWSTSDGVVVVDRTGIVRRFPRRRIADVGHADLAASFLTLDDLFAEVSEVPIRIAARDDLTMSAVAAAAGRRGATERIWLAHDDLEVLARWRDLAPQIRLVNTTTVESLEFGPERRAAELAAARVDAVALPEKDWSGGLVTLFHRFEVLAFGDGAHFERQLVRLIDMGIDAVSGEHADRMAAAAATFD